MMEGIRIAKPAVQMYYKCTENVPVLKNIEDTADIQNRERPAHYLH